MFENTRWDTHTITHTHTPTHTHTGFQNTELHGILQAMGIQRVFICGLVTSACVLNTVGVTDTLTHWHNRARLMSPCTWSWLGLV